MIGLLMSACTDSLYFMWMYNLQSDCKGANPQVMTFGKHKGVAIADIPADYNRWLLGQADVDRIS
jgi:hypothetical protein